MPTDDERREVARRLREIRLCKSGHIAWWEIARALGLKQPAGWFGWEKFEPDSANLLADLIEPSASATPTPLRRITDASATVGVSQRDALLALAEGLDCKADDIIRAAEHARFSGLGPRMGEAKHDAYEWRCIARCIRGALGEP